MLFITPNHPLAQQAALSVEPSKPLLCNLKVTSDIVPAGSYAYAIYRWQRHGLKEDFTFQPLTTVPALTAQMLDLLEAARLLDTEQQAITEAQEVELEKSHYSFWLNARSAHIEKVQRHAQARLDSLATTHKARIAVLQEQHDANSSDKIQKMKNSQMAAAERDYQQHKEQLEQAARQADILAEAVVFGILVIEEKP